MLPSHLSGSRCRRSVEPLTPLNPPDSRQQLDPGGVRGDPVRCLTLFAGFPVTARRCSWGSTNQRFIRRVTRLRIGKFPTEVMNGLDRGGAHGHNGKCIARPSESQLQLLSYIVVEFASLILPGLLFFASSLPNLPSLPIDIVILVSILSRFRYKPHSTPLVPPCYRAIVLSCYPIEPQIRFFDRLIRSLFHTTYAAFFVRERLL